MLASLLQISSVFSVLGALLYIIIKIQAATTKRNITDETIKILKDVGMSPEQAERLPLSKIKYLLDTKSSLNNNILNRLENELNRKNKLAKGVLIATLIMFGVTLFLMIPKKVTSCGDIDCETCQECYFLGCFDTALSCFDEKNIRTDKDAKLRTECQKILRGDKFLSTLNFNEALKFYSSLTDDFAIKQRECQKEFCIGLIKSRDLEEVGKYKEAYELVNKFKNRCTELPPQTNKEIENSIRRIEEKIKKKDNDKPKLKWEGKWLQKQSGKNGEITGEISITFDYRFINAFFVDRFENGIIQKGKLTNLDFSHDAKQLSGKWINENTNKEGFFQLNLDTVTNTFNGYYMMPNDNKRYYWKGNKIQ